MNGNRTPKGEPEKTRKPQASHSPEWLTAALTAMAEVFQAEMTPTALRLWCDALKGHGEAAVTGGLRSALRDWRTAGRMPVPGFVLERIEAHYAEMQKRRVEQNTARLLARGDKPDGWDPEHAARKDAKGGGV